MERTCLCGSVHFIIFLPTVQSWVYRGRICLVIGFRPGCFAVIAVLIVDPICLLVTSTIIFAIIAVLRSCF